MIFNPFFGIAAAIWLAGIGACIFATRLSRSTGARRFGVALGLSLAALGLGYVGLTRFSIVASRTVNGETVWRFDSRWFFIALLVCGALALLLTLWRRKPAIAP